MNKELHFFGPLRPQGNSFYGHGEDNGIYYSLSFEFYNFFGIRWAMVNLTFRDVSDTIVDSFCKKVKIKKRQVCDHGFVKHEAELALQEFGFTGISKVEPGYRNY